MSAPRRYFVGWDPSQMAACNIAQTSAARLTTVSLEIHRLALERLVANGIYTRPTRLPSDGTPGYWDEISEAPMSTGHAISRFFVPMLSGYEGWALFTDGDVLFRRDPKELFAHADERYAVVVVKHPNYDSGAAVKMEGQAQTNYARKNWSSVALFNCGHQSHRRLEPLLNTVPGRDLHRFCWLDDAEIGELHPGWNFLVGHSDERLDPGLVHFTDGIPNMPGYEHVPYADEWYEMAKKCHYKFTRPAKGEAVA